MKPYSQKRNPKGFSGLRKSKVSCHRKRCLRVDKKSARRMKRDDLLELL